MTQQFHKFWLKLAGVSLALFGILGFLGTMPATNEPLRWSLDLLAWPLDGFPSYQSREIWFLSALAGGFLMGWGVTVWGMAHWLYDVASEPVRKTFLTGMCSWFLLDSAGSIASGNWPNAVWNIAVLLFLVGPLWKSSKISEPVV